MIFGVAIFICTQAQTQGFTKKFVDSTIGSNGAIILREQFRPRYDNLIVAPKNAKVEAARRRYFEGITNASEIMRISRRFLRRCCLRAGSARNADGAGRFRNRDRRSLRDRSRACSCRRPISARKSSAANSRTFATIPARSLSVHDSPKRSGWKRATRCNCFRRTASTGASPSPQSRAAGWARSIPPAFMPSRRSPSACCTSPIRRP